MPDGPHRGEYVPDLSSILGVTRLRYGRRRRKYGEIGEGGHREAEEEDVDRPLCGCVLFRFSLSPRLYWSKSSLQLVFDQSGSVRSSSVHRSTTAMRYLLIGNGKRNRTNENDRLRTVTGFLSLLDAAGSFLPFPLPLLRCSYYHTNSN